MTSPLVGPKITAANVVKYKCALPCHKTGNAKVIRAVRTISRLPGRHGLRAGLVTGTIWSDQSCRESGVDCHI